MSDNQPHSDLPAAHPAATSAAGGGSSLAPLPQAGGESDGAADAIAPSSSGEGVGGGGRPRDGRDDPQPHPAATRQLAAKSRCPSPEGEGAGLAPITPHNQWTRARMVAFLRELAATQSVAAAAKAVGMSRTAAYNLRNRLQGQPFALGWEVALECGMHALAQAVMDRALNGEEIQHFYHGELVGTTRRYDNRLAQWVLENPWRVGRHQVAREYAGGDFDTLLERIEFSALTWEKGEAVPGPGWPFRTKRVAEESEARFLKHSWYMADGAEYMQRRGRPGR